MAATRPRPPRLGEIRRYDPEVVRANPRGGSYVKQGICSHSRFCGGAEAKFMICQHNRRGPIWLALCEQHALAKVGGDPSKLPQ